MNIGWNFEDDINDEIGKINPSNTFGLCSGMEFGINVRSSFSLDFSFKHVYQTV